MNDVEAFLATQEAIKIQLDIERNLTDYTIYNTQGRRILAATEEILNNARKEPDEEVKITTLDREWIEYQEDPRYKYKEFTIHSINKEAGKIKKEANKDIRVIDTVTKAEKTEFYDGDKFYLILPKNVGQEVILTFSYDNKEGLLMYKCNQNGKNYILAEQGTEHIETNIFIISAIETQVEIINQDKDTKEPIAGNIFDIINEDKSLVVGYLITNNEGKAVVPLDRGRYYLKQKEAIDGYNLNKALIEINIEKIEPVKIVVESTKSITEEITNINKETNMIEEDRNIIETNITEVSNIKTTNINREIINQTNETNLDNVNNFINTINRKNVLNLQKENTYRNYIDEPDVVQNEILEGENITLHMTRKDYINYIDMIMLNSAKVPILPVASKH